MKLEREGIMWEFDENDPTIDIFIRAGYEEVKEEKKPAKKKVEGK